MESMPPSEARPPLPGEVAWYATGRYYIDTLGAVQDVGYFLYLRGLPDDLFQGDPCEGAAHLTFASNPFRTAHHLKNGDLSVALDTVGDFSLFLNRQPSATFDDPRSFAAGEKIATFHRTSIEVGTTIGVTPGHPGLLSLNVFSAALVWSRPFDFRGQIYDFCKILPNGFTQWGTASTTSVAPPDGFTSVVPFVGSAVAIGGRTE